MNSKDERILIISDQPGTSKSLAPLRKHLQKYSFIEMRYKNFWSKEDEVFEFQNTAELIELIKKSSLVITGSSYNVSLFRDIWNLCRELGTPYIAFVEQWTSIPQRFTLKTKYDSLPDCIAVVDSNCARKIQDAHISTNVCITGHPYLEVLSRRKILAPENNLVFVSEPFSELSADLHDANSDFDEYHVLKILIKILDQAPLQKLFIKFHPRENTKKYDDILDSYNGKKEIKIISNEENVYDLSPKYFVGLTSIMLIEAAAQGLSSASYMKDVIAKENSFLDCIHQFPCLDSEENLLQWLLAPSNHFHIEAAENSLEKWKDLIEKQKRR